MPGRAKFRNHDFQISQNFSFWQVFENYNIIWCFYFWRILVITAPSPPPFFKNIQLFPPIYTCPCFHFRKIDMTSKNYWGFIRFPPPHCSGGRREVDAMIMPDIYFFAQVTLKYWVGVQRRQSYLMGRRCLFSLGWLPF